MSYIFVGLGNPGEEYEGTRHNAGRAVLQLLVSKPPTNFEVSDWKADKKLNADVATFEYKKTKGKLVLPNTFMNLSGKALINLVTSKKKAEELVVIHDDLDLPIGSFRISFDRGSGGHKGVESIIKALKTTAFIRIRIGVSSVTPSGKIKKPHGEAEVQKFILGKFKPTEVELLKKVNKNIIEALVIILESGRVSAMNQFNQK